MSEQDPSATGRGSSRAILRWGAGAVLLLFAALQFVPVERSNRPGVGGPDVSPELRWIFRRACYDCHSTESRWPIWAYVAPMSWLVVDDVERARRVLNFSDWVAYEPGMRVALRMMIGPTTATHRMPLWYYLPLHPDARLSPSDLELLDAWARGAVEEAARPALAPSGAADPRPGGVDGVPSN